MEAIDETNCWLVVAECLSLSVAYVCSLYVWSTPLDRDHPSTIKRRLVSVTVMSVVSPVFTYFCVDSTIKNDNSLPVLLGFRRSGFLEASTIPLLLTAFLFLGPLAVKTYNEPLNQLTTYDYWSEQLSSIYWWRDHVIAPFSEELTFRASLLPVLVRCLTPLKAVVVSPMFFGVAHLHHIVGHVNAGVPVKRALLIAAFQFSYSTLFGAYSAFLFLRTGHLVAPFVAHAFCNCMGFPDFGDVLTYDEPKRSAILSLFVVGFLSWCALLIPLTNPLLYDNRLYWEICGS